MGKICLGVLFILGMTLCGAAQPSCGDASVVFDRAPKHAYDFAPTLERAQHGDVHAEFQVALAYETGNGTEQDYKEAVYW